jgi:hypothetical protein
MEIALTNLDPHFLKIIDEKSHKFVNVLLSEADGLRFLCPLCYIANNGPVGTHLIICWKPSVPQTFVPGPGRWDLIGTNFHDLSLVAGSSSILIGNGSNILSEDKCCNAHFHIINGKAVW